MLFVTLKELWGLVEVVLFPDAYQRLGGCSNHPALTSSAAAFEAGSAQSA